MKLLLFFVLIFEWDFSPKDKKIIQVDISSLLNCRPVTTLTNNKLQSWTKGIDGGGTADGYLTQAAALFKGDMDAHALPDNPIAAANAQHPQILLHYDNKDGKYNQARSVSGAGSFLITIPKDYYAAVYLGVSSAEGPSHLQCDLNYKDGEEIRNYVVPDYYTNVTRDDSVFSYAFTDLAKWDKHNNMKEKDHHNIHLLKVPLDPKRLLKSVTIIKGNDGYLVFWSATAVRN